MDTVSDLRFNLAEDENIIACGKKFKPAAYFAFSFCIFALICFSIGLGIAIYAMVYFGIFKDAVLVALSLAALDILIFSIFIHQRNNFKFNKLYLTNKRFIVITRNTIESIEFSSVNKIVDTCYQGFPIFNLCTNDKKFTFYYMDFDNLIAEFNKIYPEYNDKQESPNKLIIALLVAVVIACYIAGIYFAFKKADKQVEIVQCQFKDANEYMQYLEKNIKDNWNPPKGLNNNSTKVVVKFEILQDGTITNLSLLRDTKNIGVSSSAMRAVQKTRLTCPLPDCLKDYKKVPIEFTFDYNVKK